MAPLISSPLLVQSGIPRVPGPPLPAPSSSAIRLESSPFLLSGEQFATNRVKSPHVGVATPSPPRSRRPPGKLLTRSTAEHHPMAVEERSLPSQVLPSPDSPLKPRHGAVVVGGGPAGVAVALALAKLRGWSDVTLVERLPELTWYDPDRAYVYGVSGRGQQTLRMLGLEKEMVEVGMGGVALSFTTVDAEGKVSIMERKSSGPMTYLMERPGLMKVLAGGLEEFNKGAGTLGTQVRVLTSSRVVKIEKVRGKEGEGERLVVVVSTRRDGEEGEEETVLFPSLVLGCDGINSVVRRELQRWSAKGHVAGANTGHVAPHTAEQLLPPFSLKQYPSPSQGLRFKVLRLPPTLTFRDGRTFDNLTSVNLPGLYKGQKIRISTWRVKDPTATRPGTMITRADHPMWQIPLGDTAAYRSMFAEAFPQIDINSQVPDDIMDLFAKSEGGVFPVPSASQGMAYVLGGSKGAESSADSSATSAVVLIGDAAHSFPPDIGQGVNAALQDVYAFVQHLERSSNDVASAALAYQAEREPEAHALCRLTGIGNPYFYGQDPVGAKIWQANVILRTALSKALGKKLIAPPAIMTIPDTSLSYSQIMKWEDEANLRLRVGLLSVAVLVSALALSNL